MSTLRDTLTITAIGLTCAAPVAAQEYDLGQMTIAASLQPVEISETGASVTVLTQDDLQRGGNLSLAQQIARTPGVSISGNGGLGTLTTLRIRGLGSAYVGARLDGIDITDPTGTQTGLNFGTILTPGLSRVEILRGPQSALYGANATGGVVDMRTWRPTRNGPSGQINVEGGSNHTWSGAASAGYRDDRAEFALTAGRTITRGISAASAGTEDDGFQSSSISAYGRYALTDTFAIGANGFWQDSRTDIDGSVYDWTTGTSAVTDTPDVSDATLRAGRVFAELTTGEVAHTLSYARSRTDRTITYPDQGTEYDYRGNRNVSDYAGHWVANDMLTLDWGASRTKETADFWGASSDGAGSAWTNSTYGEALFSPNTDLDLSLALRHDVHQNFGGKTTGRAALAWRGIPDWTLRAVAATGYRAPSLYELHSQYGSTTLQPEKSTSYEIGAERLFENGSLQATLFHTRIKDRILWDNNARTCASFAATGYAGCYAQVGGNTTVKGVEISGGYEISPDWRVNGNYTYTDAVQNDANGSVRAVQVPRNTANIALTGTIATVWQITGSVSRVMGTVDSQGDLPDYTLVNLQIGYDITPTTQAYVRVDNIFDADYETVRGYNQPGRQAFFGIRATF